MNMTGAKKGVLRKNTEFFNLFLSLLHTSRLFNFIIHVHYELLDFQNNGGALPKLSKTRKFVHVLFFENWVGRFWAFYNILYMK